MMGFFAIRRLIESKGRLSQSTIRRPIRLTQFTSKSQHVTLLNCHKIDRHFNLASPRPKYLGLEDLCNQFIHSYVFTPFFGVRLGLQGFLVSSERKRKRALYEVPVRTVITVFRRAAADDPNSIHGEFDTSIGDYRVTARMLKDREHAA